VGSRWLSGLGLVVAAALLRALLLAAYRYYQGTLPFPLNLLAMLAAIGLPAYLVGIVASRRQLPLPPAWAVAGYCLGSGVATAVLMGAGETAGRYALTALAHAASFTVLVPAVGGGFVTVLENLLWMAVVVVTAIYGAESRQGRTRAEPQA